MDDVDRAADSDAAPPAASSDPPERPLLLLDVDGPLNPYAAGAQPPGYGEYVVTGMPAGPLRLWLRPAHGERLLSLPYRLVWATTWMHEANTVIGDRVLGLPPLPVIEWPTMFTTDDPDGLYWKTRHVAAWAAGRTFAWVDDEITAADAEWIAEHHAGEALLRQINPARGLVEEDFEALEAWARELDRGRPGTGPDTPG